MHIYIAKLFICNRQLFHKVGKFYPIPLHVTETATQSLSFFVSLNLTILPYPETPARAIVAQLARLLKRAGRRKKWENGSFSFAVSFRANHNPSEIIVSICCLEE